MPLLRVSQPFDFELTTERFRAFGPDLASLWHEGGLHRVVGGREVRLEAAAGGVLVEPLDAEVQAEVQKLLGLDFDLEAFARWAQSGDPVIARLAVQLAGFRPPIARDPFEMLVGSISAQQVSLRAAFAIRNRFVQKFGERAEHAYAFPTRERTARARQEQLVALGFSQRKSEYILGLARSDLDLHALATLPDDEVKSQLTGLRGLGEWTADWFLARHLGRPEAWPAGDLGLRKAVAAFYLGSRDVTIEEVRAMGSQFAPFQNLSAHYLLTGLRVAGV